MNKPNPVVRCPACGVPLPCPCKKVPPAPQIIDLFEALKVSLDEAKKDRKP